MKTIFAYASIACLVNVQASNLEELFDVVLDEEESQEEFFDAVLDKDVQRIYELLKTGQIDINARDQRGLPPLAIAALNGYEDIARILVALGARKLTDEEIQKLKSLSGTHGIYSKEMLRNRDEAIEYVTNYSLGRLRSSAQEVERVRRLPLTRERRKEVIEKQQKEAAEIRKEEEAWLMEKEKLREEEKEEERRLDDVKEEYDIIQKDEAPPVRSEEEPSLRRDFVRFMKSQMIR